MNYLKIILLIVGPYIPYAIIIKIIQDKLDIELDKILKGMIFILIDIIVFIIFK